MFTPRELFLIEYMASNFRSLAYAAQAQGEAMVDAHLKRIANEAVLFDTKPQEFDVIYDKAHRSQ